MADHVAIDRAVVSPARRASDTWELMAAAYETRPPTIHDDRAYSFDGRVLLDIVLGLDEADHTVALVGHNPAMEEIVQYLTGSWQPMPTACVAVIDLPGPWRDAATGGVLRAHGRPPHS